MHWKTTLRTALVITAACAGLGAGNVIAQQYPTKIVRVVNPNQPGGNSDVLFRLLAPKMGEVLGQQLVIDYRPGAGGNIGAELVSKAPPDGYTTLIAAASFLINPSLIVEVLSPSTEDYDRGEKLAHYKQIPSLEEVILVAHEERRLELWRRAGDHWTLHVSRGEETASVASLGCELSLADVYRNPLPGSD